MLVAPKKDTGSRSGADSQHSLKRAGSLSRHVRERPITMLRTAMEEVRGKRFSDKLLTINTSHAVPMQYLSCVKDLVAKNSIFLARLMESGRIRKSSYDMGWQISAMLEPPLVYLSKTLLLFLKSALL
jgi:hypothetical protein